MDGSGESSTSNSGTPGSSNYGGQSETADRHSTGKTDAANQKNENPSSTYSNQDKGFWNSFKSKFSGILASWKAAENMSAEDLAKRGFTVVKQVGLTATTKDGSTYTMRADSAATREGMVVVTEVKDGLGAKLLPAQKAAFEAAMNEGKVAIQNPLVSKKLGLSKITNLAEARGLAVRLDGTLTGRAAASLARQMGWDGVATVVRFGVRVGAAVGGIGFDLATMSKDANQ